MVSLEVIALCGLMFAMDATNEGLPEDLRESGEVGSQRMADMIADGTRSNQEIDALIDQALARIEKSPTDFAKLVPHMRSACTAIGTEDEI